LRFGALEGGAAVSSDLGLVSWPSNIKLSTCFVVYLLPDAVVAVCYFFFYFNSCCTFWLKVAVECTPDYFSVKKLLLVSVWADEREHLIFMPTIMSLAC